MTITGMVYPVLLRPFEADVGLIDPWVNFVLHSLGPAALLIDWLLFPGVGTFLRRWANERGQMQPAAASFPRGATGS